MPAVVVVVEAAAFALPPFGRTLRHAAMAVAEFLPAEPVLTPWDLRQDWNFANVALFPFRTPPGRPAPPKPPDGRRLAQAVRALWRAGDGVGLAPPPAPG